MKKKKLLWLVSFFPLMLSCHQHPSTNNSVKANDSARSSETPKTNEQSDATLDPGCNPALWKNVYDPSRLEVLDKCKVVTGIIEESNADPDGDQHMLLKLDKGQKDLLNKKNKKKKEGDLVIEVVCVNNITREKAKGACKGYQNNIALPAVGDHVKVTGSYVIDSHNGWAEIHPVSKIEKMN